jgi:glycosyltransferase involved in cell wall biosynthesis
MILRSPSRVVLGRRDIAHHGAHSGYARLVTALRAKLPVAELDGSGVKRLPQRLSRRLITRTGMPWYDTGAMSIDLGVAGALWRGELCHLLYGEDTLHYSGLARRLGAPGRLVVTFHQPPTVFDEVVRDRRPLAGVDAAIAMSSELRDHLSTCAGGRPAFYVPLGVDTGFFRPPAISRREPATCLFVGWWQRDLELLGAVVRCVRSQAPSVRFDAVVPEWTRADVKAATGIQPVASISDDDLLRRYQRATVVVVPLKTAAANNTLLEAAATGCPIVATDVGGVRDHLGPDGAELVPPGDPEAMSARVLDLLACPSRRGQLGARARERALELDWDGIAERHLKVYRHACSGRIDA